MLVEVTKVCRSWLEIDLVCRPGQIPYAEFMPGMTLVKQGFKKTVMPSVIKNSTSDECDPVPLHQFEGQGGHNRLGLL